MGFSDLFKSKTQREQDREMEIQNALNLHRRQIKKLYQHERDYMKKALEAKRAMDMPNYKDLCGMVMQTIVHRRTLESQLRRFEMILQTRNYAKLFGEFAKGMGAMAKSVNEVFSDFSQGDVMRNIETMLAQCGDMEGKIDMVTERIAEAGDTLVQNSNMPEVQMTEIEKMIGRLETEEGAGRNDGDIDQKLKQLEAEIAEKKLLS